jgi:CPA2 family monovalent cation:H+ antiporter-2
LEQELLRDIVIILACSAIVIYVLNRFRMPPIVGFIAAGIIIGPSGLGVIENPAIIESLAEIGIILLLFVVGIEFSMSEFMRLKKPAFLGGGLQVGLTGGLAFAIAYLITGDVRLSVFIGFLVSLSSTAIVFKMLSERGQIDSPQGRSMVGILIFQDLCVVPMMLLTYSLAGEGEIFPGILLTLAKGTLMVVVVLLLARWAVPAVLHRIVHTKSTELFTISIILSCLGIAFLTSKFGISLALGAFLAGLIISESEYAFEATAKVLPLKDSFLGLFFVSVGMLIDVKFMYVNLSILALAVAAVFVLKALIASGVVFAVQGSPRVAAISGLGLAQVGEFSLVLAAVGKSTGLMPAEAYQMFLSASLVTMLFTPFVMSASPRAAEFIMRAGPLKRLEPTPPGEYIPKSLSGHVFIIGFGVVGRNLARTLKGTGLPYVVLELNNDIVRAERRKGEPIYFGEGTSLETLKKLGILRARLLLIAISDPAATRKIVAIARIVNPDIYIIVRTRYVGEVDDLHALGANEVIPEEFVASVEIFSRVLNIYNVPRNVVDDHVEDIRKGGYMALRKMDTARRLLSEELPMLSEIVTESYLLKGPSRFIGHSLSDLRLRSRTGATVMAIKRGDTIHQNPDADFVFEEGDIILLVGRPSDIGRAVEYIESGDSPNIPHG